MKIDMASSEESGKESDGEVLLVKPLPWRSAKVDKMFTKLDNKIDAEKSAQDKCQSKRRALSVALSDRGELSWMGFQKVTLELVAHYRYIDNK